MLFIGVLTLKRVIVEQPDGYVKAFWVRDNDQDTRFGIPEVPPDLNRLDWESVKKELTNLLTTEGYITFQDIQRRDQEFTGIVLAVVRTKLVQLYKLQDQEVKK